MPFAPPLTLAEAQASFAGKYIVDTPIQAGGQGAVFKARALSSSGAVVALKVYCPDQLEERLEREFNALKALSTPTLVELCDAGTCSMNGVVEPPFRRVEPFRHRKCTHRSCFAH